MERREHHYRDILNNVRKLIRVRNVDAAKKRLDAFIDSKISRGYRLRVIEDRPRNALEISHNNTLAVRMAIRELKNCNQYVRELPWRLHTTLRKPIGE